MLLLQTFNRLTTNRRHRYLVHFKREGSVPTTFRSILLTCILFQCTSLIIIGGSAYYVNIPAPFLTGYQQSQKQELQQQQVGGSQSVFLPHRPLPERQNSVPISVILKDVGQSNYPIGSIYAPAGATTSRYQVSSSYNNNNLIKRKRPGGSNTRALLQNSNNGVNDGANHETGGGGGGGGGQGIGRGGISGLARGVQTGGGRSMVGKANDLDNDVKVAGQTVIGGGDKGDDEGVDDDDDADIDDLDDDDEYEDDEPDNQLTPANGRPAVAYDKTASSNTVAAGNKNNPPTKPSHSNALDLPRIIKGLGAGFIGRRRR